MDGACGKYGKEEKCIQDFEGKLKEGDRLEELFVMGKNGMGVN